MYYCIEVYIDHSSGTAPHYIGQEYNEYRNVSNISVANSDEKYLLFLSLDKQKFYLVVPNISNKFNINFKLVIPIKIFLQCTTNKGSKLLTYNWYLLELRLSKLISLEKKLLKVFQNLCRSQD